ncbi:histidine kinase [Camelimonas fluminis]|uniref:Blue-light-activated histidine kinase n=1 Tax=Camelimonas fluminis TaxID=1576911 RepID=A0ABV7UFX6_9HYPH|nr:response regulator [Camelimonas fluminis]GHE70929.1 histidine kinase [Camelimonas fluminis]
MPADPIRFLIVDDVAENLLALDALLQREGLEIHHASSAPEALELMLVHDYALAFLDVHMPETNGYELAELMRGAERTRRVPIIFVTAAERDDTRRFRGYEAGAVDYIFKPIDPLVLKSKAEVFFRIGQQARDLERQRDELRAIASHRDLAIARLKAHADNSPLAYVEIDSALTILAWSAGAERMFGRSAEAVAGRLAGEIAWLAPEGLDVLRGWLRPEADVPPRYAAEANALGPDGANIHCEIYGSVLRDPITGKLSLSLQILDVSERHRSEKVRTLLIGELHHRIKNTLANVQAIARQTLRQSDSLGSFEQSFGGRLQALSRAHAILSDATWSSTLLDQLVHDQFQAGTLDRDRVHLHGPKVELSPENTLRMALSLHELGTNAAKYGALSAPAGEVLISWRRLGDGLELQWEERGGPPVTPPKRAGFGSTLIRSGAGADPDAISVEWRPAGVIWTIRLSDGVTHVAAAPLPARTPPAPLPDDGGFDGCRILVVEDEPLIAFDLSSELEEAGAEIVAIAATVSDALAVAETGDIDLAVLDGNLCGKPVDPVAIALSGRNIPFCFVSGYGRAHLPQDFPDTPVVEKPFRPEVLFSVLRSLRNTASANRRPETV